MTYKFDDIMVDEDRLTYGGLIIYLSHMIVDLIPLNLRVTMKRLIHPPLILGNKSSLWLWLDLRDNW